MQYVSKTARVKPMHLVYGSPDVPASQVHVKPVDGGGWSTQCAFSVEIEINLTMNSMRISDKLTSAGQRRARIVV